MAAVTATAVLTGSYALVATGAVRMVARAPQSAQVRIVPTGAAAPAATDAGFTVTGFTNFDNLGSACDVYARGSGVLHLFTNTA